MSVVIFTIVVQTVLIFTIRITIVVVGCPTWIRTKSSYVRGSGVAITPSGICLAEGGGVEPHPYLYRT